MSQIQRSYGTTSTAELKAIYDDWAVNYDKELAEAAHDYVGPAVAATYVAKCLGGDRISPEVRILDAGCGTGLVGAELAKLGARNIDGVDLSPGMLKVARSLGAYKDLDAVDLSQPLTKDTDSYDVVVCVGTMTQGHVGPAALDEFLRVVRKGGFIVATILGEIWESGGYEAHVKKLLAEGRATFVSAELEDYRRGAGVQARMLVLQNN